MNIAKNRQKQRLRRRMRIRAKVSGTANKPRLAVYKSNTTVYGQLIDDKSATTLCAANSRTNGVAATDRERAFEAGKVIADAAKKHKIDRVVFDRNGFIYTGRVRAFADGARDGGLTF